MCLEPNNRAKVLICEKTYRAIALHGWGANKRGAKAELIGAI